MWARIHAAAGRSSAAGGIGDRDRPPAAWGPDGGVEKPSSGPELRAMEIATADAAGALLPDLLRRLRRHQAALGGSRVLALYRRWRIRRLARAVADARWQVEQGRAARLGGLDTRR